MMIAGCSDKNSEDAINKAREFNSSKRVLCYGDSMMEGYGGEGVTVPNTLADLSGATVLNYGIYAESTSCVSARMGANPQYLVEEIAIPSETTPIKAQFSGKYGYEMLLNFGDAGINNVFIDGIEGVYFMNEDGDRMFQRLSPGEEKIVKRGTLLVTHAMVDKKPDDIIVIWCGSNDNPQNADDIDAVIDRINEMLAYCEAKEYVVIGETTFMDRFPVINELNEAYAKEYGEHFLDIRKYLMEQALDDLGITPTDADIAAVQRGDVPESIRVDDSHGNSDYYRLVGQQLYKKMTELGYLK